MSLVKFSQKYSLSRIIQSTVIAVSSTFIVSTTIVSTTSADLLYTADFETDIKPINRTSDSYGPLRSSGNSPIIVPTENGITPRGGSYMMKTYLHRYNSNTTYRTEAVAAAHQNFNGMFEKGKDYWMGVSIFIPADWSMDYRGTKNGKAVEERIGGGIILQFHDRGYKDSSWRSGLPFVINHRKDGFNIWNRSDGCRNRTECDNNANIKNSIKRFNKSKIPMKRGEWNDFVMHIKWSPSSDGRIRTWVNGKLELDSKGANYHNEHATNAYPYFKMGLYQSSYGKGDWSKEIKWNTLERTLYHDELRIGDASSSYKEVMPAGKSPEKDIQAPSKPGMPKASNITDTSIKLNWTASTDNVGISGYEVNYNGKTKIVSNESTTLTGLTPNMNYSIKVRAIDAAGNKSAYSDSGTAVTDAGQTIVCAQVLTPAWNPETNEEKVFPTSCIPDGWVKGNAPSDNNNNDNDNDTKSDNESSGGSFPIGLFMLSLLALVRRK